MSSPAMMGPKSSFNKTCNLFGQYLKEMRFSGDLNLANPDANVEPKGTSNVDSAMSTMNLFPLSSGVVFYDETIPKSAPTGTASPQMTIFYNGQVIVYNDVSAEKCKEIIELASKGSDALRNGVDVAGQPMGLASPVVCSNVSAPVFTNRMKVSDLPIVRKASLQRFFEKRKDRLNAKAPYTLNNPTPDHKSKPKPEQSKSATSPWLGLAAQPELRS
ncbi:TIFY 10A-like protein [Drosera capensis]